MAPNMPVRLDGDDLLDPEQIVALGFLASYPVKTRDTYGINLRQWFTWCKARGLNPLQASRAHIEVYARELEERKGLKVSTVANKLNTIAGFYRFAVMDCYIENNPAEYIRKPRVPRQSTTLALTRREFYDVWELAKQSPHTSDLILIGLLGCLGLRVGEAIAIDIEDISQQGPYLIMKVQREKGNRSGGVPFPMPMIGPIQRVMKYERTGPLLRKTTGDRMDQKAANRIVHRLCKQAGITKRITPHSFRHTFVTLSHDAGVSPRIIQQSMGYADLRMVSYYDRFNENPAVHAGHSVAAFVELG